MTSDRITIITLLVLMGAVLLSTLIAAMRYKKVPPDKAMVILGKRQRGGRGYRVISGGAKVVVPIVESIEWLDLKVHHLELDLTDVRADVRGLNDVVAVGAVAEVKIGSDESNLNAAAENLLGKSDREIDQLATAVREGHNRGTCATLAAASIDSDRDEFATQVAAHASDDLRKLGLEIRSLRITGVKRTPGAMIGALRKLTGLEAQVTARYTRDLSGELLSFAELRGRRPSRRSQTRRLKPARQS